MNTEKVIKELKRQYPDLIGIYLFGSRAKGSSHAESDLDTLLLFPSLTSEKKFEIYGIVGYVEYKFEVFIDIKILTPPEFRKNPFFYEQVTNFGTYIER